MNTKKKHIQLDLFGQTETIEDQLHRLKCKQEKMQRSFFQRYNLVLRELEEIKMEIEEIEHARENPSNKIVAI